MRLKNGSVCKASGPVANLEKSLTHRVGISANRKVLGTVGLVMREVIL